MEVKKLFTKGIDNNIKAVTGLSPQEVWKHFAVISSIPRGSKNESRVIQYIAELAVQQKLMSMRVGLDNLLVRIPPSVGYEEVPSICLQAHVDMVWEPKDHDFENIGIEFRVDGDYLKANGTTLGGDNGIGLAIMMAYMINKNLKHGPLELLFTVDEETGCNGAKRIEPNFILSRLLINLDSEERDSIYIGCAGGGYVTGISEIDYVKVDADGPDGVLTISIEGLLGGHSGGDIHEGRANAIKLLGEILSFLRKKKIEIYLTDISGGNSRNAIPSEAKASFLFYNSKSTELIESLEKIKDELKNRYKDVDPNISIDEEYIRRDSPVVAFSQEYTDFLLKAINTVPHGVIRMDSHHKSLVETSNNLATINIVDDNKVEVVAMYRSSDKEMLETVGQDISKILGKYIFKVNLEKVLSAWQPNYKSYFLDDISDVYKRVNHHNPTILITHGGLEPAIFAGTIPDMDMVSIGPTIKNVHTTEEVVDIKSVELFFKFLTTFLEEYSL